MHEVTRVKSTLWTVFMALLMVGFLLIFFPGVIISTFFIQFSMFCLMIYGQTVSPDYEDYYGWSTLKARFSLCIDVGVADAIRKSKHSQHLLSLLLMAWKPFSMRVIVCFSFKMHPLKVIICVIIVTLHKAARFIQPEDRFDIPIKRQCKAYVVHL